MSWRRHIIEQQLVDLHAALLRQFKHPGKFRGSPRRVTEAHGKAFAAFDTDDLDAAERWCLEVERLIIEEGVALRADPESWTRQRQEEAAAA
jgi:hypothetical protein